MALSSPDFQYGSTLVRQKSAIVLEIEKSCLSEARLAPPARAEGYPALDAMVAQMRAGPPNGLHHADGACPAARLLDRGDHRHRPLG